MKGTVTYNGPPLAVGTITFVPTGKKGIKCGERIENGHYQIDPPFRPMPGPHRVEIRSDKPTGKKYKNEFGEVFDVTREGLPDKYHSWKKTVSPLTAAIFPIPITAQSGRANFNLSAGGRIISHPLCFLEEVGRDST